MMNATDEFVSFILQLKQTAFPKTVIQKSKECVLDYLGCVFAGANINKDKFHDCPFENGKCELFGLGIKTNSATAAFINGFNAHTAELDDGNRFGMIHLGANILSALFAVYQEKSISFERLITANIIGYEAGVRISLAMQPGHKKKGFHTSGTAGTLASAIAVAVALDCDEKQLKAVISAAATSAAGLLEIQSDASELKPYNIGHAAMSGITAAYVGMLGFRAPQDILNGERGMLKLLSDTQNTDYLYKECDKYEIERIYIKPYAACRHCHSAIEAAISIKEKYHISANDITKITVYTYALAIKGHDHTEIGSISAAKLSIPFSVAVAFIYGKAGLNEYSQNSITNNDILSLSKKVVIQENKEFTNDAASKRIAQVVVDTIDNRQYSERVDYAKGDPENPMRLEELIDKFSALMKWSGNEGLTNQITKEIFNG